MKKSPTPTPQPRPHLIESALLARQVRVALVGCGGNGGQMLSGLARLDVALRACGHPFGLHVVAFDPDTVSHANIGRQLFYPCDIGTNKAQVLVHRLNVSMGLAWEAISEEYTSVLFSNPGPINGWTASSPFDVVISCTDTVSSRRTVHHSLLSLSQHGCYWLDLGNSAREGQVILGQPRPGYVNYTAQGIDQVTREGEELRWSAERAVAQANKRRQDERLPTVMDLNPEMLDESFEEEDAPSCSLREALTRQDLFINQGVATWGLQLLWTLFRKREIEHHAYYINLESGRVTPRLVPSMQVAARPMLVPRPKPQAPARVPAKRARKAA